MVLFGANIKPKKFLTWHQIRLKRKGIMKRNNISSPSSMCAINVCLVQLQDMHDMQENVTPSKIFAVSFLHTILRRNKVSFTQKHVLLSLN